MSTVANPNYKKGFVPFAIAALLVSLIGGFTAVLGPAFVADQGLTIIIPHGFLWHWRCLPPHALQSLENWETCWDAGRRCFLVS